MKMKCLAEELKRLSKREPYVTMYEDLLEELMAEARAGGNHMVVTFGKDNYNPIVERLISDGFEVIINNYDPQNVSYMTFIVWDKEEFNKILEEATHIDKSKFHYGLI